MNRACLRTQSLLQSLQERRKEEVVAFFDLRCLGGNGAHFGKFQQNQRYFLPQFNITTIMLTCVDVD